MNEENQTVEIPQFHLTHSPEIGKLAGALAKAQGTFDVVTKDSSNPFFKSKYADLATVIAATKKALSENGLALIQSPGNISGRSLSLTSMLVHSSGEWFRGELEMPLKEATAQGVGSAITYARRYAAQALLNVAGEDDDGNAATGRQEAPVFKPEEQPINPAQAKAIWDAVKRTGKTNDQLAHYLETAVKVKQVEQVHKIDFQMVLKWANAPLPVAQDLTPALQESLDQVNGRKASASLQKRFAALFASAGEKGVPEADIKKFAYETFHVDSMTKLSEDQLKGVQEWLQSL